MARRAKNEAQPLTETFRGALDNLRLSYAAGTNSRFRPQPHDVAPSGSGADYHYRREAEYLRMIERSRYFDRNNMVVAQAVDRLVANVMQEGFPLDVDVSGNDATEATVKEANTRLSERWAEWSADEDACDFEGEKTFPELAALTLRHTVVDGDVFNLPQFVSGGGAIQQVEAHRCRTPRNTRKNVVHGIEVESNGESRPGRRKSYWITREEFDPLRALERVRDVAQIDARDEGGFRQVFHNYFPRRTSQRRGVTAMAPTVDVVGMHDDVQFANLVKAQVASCFAIFEELQQGAPPNTGGQTGAETTEELTDGSTRTMAGISPGMRVKGGAGVKLQGFSPNIPNPEFFPHATLLLSFIAINLDLPVAVLMLDPSQTNFSGWRGAMDQARQRFRVIQRNLAAKFHRHVYTWKVRQWIATDDALRRLAESLPPGAIFKHRWHPPTWRYIEPMKDAAADDLRVSRNLTSQRRRAAEQGYDWQQVAGEIVEDRALLVELAIARAAAINKAEPDAKVDWRELAYGHQSSGVRYVFGADLNDDADDSKPNEDTGKASGTPVNGSRYAHN